jgi:hypothetical protein
MEVVLYKMLKRRAYLLELNECQTFIENILKNISYFDIKLWLTPYEHTKNLKYYDKNNMDEIGNYKKYNAIEIKKKTTISDLLQEDLLEELMYNNNNIVLFFKHLVDAEKCFNKMNMNNTFKK